MVSAQGRCRPGRVSILPVPRREGLQRMRMRVGCDRGCAGGGGLLKRAPPRDVTGRIWRRAANRRRTSVRVPSRQTVAGKRGASGRGRRKRRAPRPTGRSGPRPAWPAPASRRARAGDAGGSSGPAGPLGARTPPARRPRCPKGAVRAGGGGEEDLPLGLALLMRALQGRNGVTQWARWPAPGRVAPSQGRPGRVASQAVGSARCCSCAKP